jgi:hypothetical protein
MKHQFPSVIEKRGKWYVADVEEIPAVNTPGRTLAEARLNLKGAFWPWSSRATVGWLLADVPARLGENPR